MRLSAGHRKAKGPGPQSVIRRKKRGTRFWVEDLQRYGIQCIEVDEYEDVDEMLRDVELALARRSVFVSGSFPGDGLAKDRESAENISRTVGRVIAKQGKRLVSGFGLTVGSVVLSGALSVVLEEAAPNLEKSLLLRPFPQEAPAGITMTEFRRRYRQSMILQAGICVVVAGTKIDGKGALKIADGVLEEYEVAKAAGRVVVPVGCTGGAAKAVWEKMKNAGVRPLGLTKAEFDLLNAPACTPHDVERALRKVMAAVEAL
jgi:hypothetical protein